MRSKITASFNSGMYDTLTVSKYNEHRGQFYHQETCALDRPCKITGNRQIEPLPLGLKLLNFPTTFHIDFPWRQSQYPLHLSPPPLQSFSTLKSEATLPNSWTLGYHTAGQRWLQLALAVCMYAPQVLTSTRLPATHAHANSVFLCSQSVSCPKLHVCLA